MTLQRRVIVFLSCALFFAWLTVSIRSITKVKPVMADLTTLPTIIIDAGHGGLDGGAVNANGSIVEKDINLSICLTLRDIFIVNGFDVVMTRDTDISIHDDGIKSVRKQKTSDLHNRLAIVESYPDAIFLSIHQNKFTSAKSRGAQIFYGPNDPRSEELASSLQSGFIAELQPENTRKYKRAGKNLYLMYNAKCPSALIECGFLSNNDEAAMLNDERYQQQIAFTVFGSVMRYLGLDQQD